MAINVLQAAKHLCKVSDWELTNLELQKIIYICHMLYMGVKGTVEKPLVKGYFQAWQFGPVHPDLYSHISTYRSEPIPKSAFSDEIEELDEKNHTDQIVMLDTILQSYPPGSVSKLMSHTHWKGGAWKKNYRRGRREQISNHDVLEEYSNYKREKLGEKSGVEK